MAEETFYHVTPSVNGWKAEQEDSDTILCEGTDKNEVMDCIREIAEKEEASHVVVHNRKGDSIQEVYFNNGRRNESEIRL